MEQEFKVGEIANTHGIRGEVKVYPTTSDIARFKKLKECILDTGKERMVLHVQSCKFFKQFAILKFKEFDNINEVEKYKHCGLYVERKNAVKLEKDEYYIADLIGMEVFDEENRRMGSLEDVIQTGANDVYVVKLAEEYKKALGTDKELPKEVLVPALKQCVLELNIEEATMKLKLLDGLLEL